MTERAYYADSYTHQFAARVSERLTVNDQPAVVLDQTFFYPNVGGQPNDRGSLNGVAVVDVLVRESDQAVVHVLANSLEGTEVQGQIDWPRRWDHMQQHTGQHILSQAFIRSAEAVTIGFHLGADSLTIDLDADKLTPAQIDRAEITANDAVSANYPIRAWFPSPAELSQIPLRKTPEVDGKLRVVAIGEFDVTACGGTHVRQSAEVGLIKILKVEKQKKGTRVEFACGNRAWSDYARKHSIVTQLASDFTCGVPEVLNAVARLRNESQALSKDLKAVRGELLDYESAKLLESASERSGFKLVRGVWPDREMADVRGLATRVTAAKGVIALLASAGDKASIVFARSADLKNDMNVLFKTAIQQLPNARGGGSPNLAQGGGAPASVEEVEKVLKFAEGQLE
jgi:alanyl-tRNA synthetase